MPCLAELNQNLVGQCVLFSVACLVCALLSYPEPLVCSICNQDPTLGLRRVQSVPCALLLGSSSWPSNDPWIGIYPSTQPSDQSLFAVC